MTDGFSSSAWAIAALKSPDLPRPPAGASPAPCTSEPTRPRDCGAEGIEAHLFDGTAALPGRGDRRRLARALHHRARHGGRSRAQDLRPPAAATRAGSAISRRPESTAITAAAGSTRRRRPGPASRAASTAGRRTRLAGDRAGGGRRGRHLPAARHLRPRPQRDRPGEGRHGPAHRQARPGLLAHPCRGHRGTCSTAITQAHAGAIYNVADDLPASTSDVIAFACELLGKPRAAGHPVGTGRAHDERHGALVLCGEPGACGTTGSRTSSASCCAIRPIARACAPSRQWPRARAPRPWRSGGRCRPGC